MTGWVVDGSNWMAGIPDGTALCDLSILGAHEADALYGGGRSQCQWLTIRDQLELGVRFLDVRCSNIDGSRLAPNERDDVERDDDFHLFHGSADEFDWFSSVQKQCAQFLADHPLETILMNVQREEVGRYINRDKSEFPDKFMRCVAKFSPPGIWSYVKPTPADPEWKIGGCRGKIILIRTGWPRPSGTSTFGLPWTGNKVSGTSEDALFWTQNGWEGPDYDDDTKKAAAVKQYLDLAADGLAPDGSSGADRFYLNFLSRAAGDKVGTHAKVVNKDILGYLQGAMSNKTGKLGVLPIDFVGNTRWRGSLEEWIIRRNTFQDGCEFQSVAQRCTVQIAYIAGKERRWNWMVNGDDQWVRSETPTAENPALVLERVIDDYRILFKAPDGRYLNVDDKGRVGLFDDGTSFYPLPGKLISEKAGKPVAVTPTGGLWCVGDAGVTHPPVNLIEQ